MTRKKKGRSGEDRNHHYKNPARSAQEYRLAQAVLSGYSDLMPKKVAREIVDETPARLRSEYMRKNPESAYDAGVAAAQMYSNIHVRPDRNSFLSAFNKWKKLVGKANVMSSSLNEFTEGFRSAAPPHWLKNPGEELSEVRELTEGFHGRPATYIEDILEVERYRTKLAHLGDLVEFEIMDHRSHKHVIPINFAEHDTDEHVSVGFPNRRQLILSGGNQSIDLDSFPDLSDNEKEKDYVNIGEIYSISYYTDKHHLEGPKYQRDGTEYIHRFGEEEGGERPILVYDKLNEHILIVGGSYEIRDEGIYN